MRRFFKYLDFPILIYQVLTNVFFQNRSYHGRQKPNLLMVGVDGISRLNSIRNLPKTYKYLQEELNAIEFLGYNKVGDSSFPNLCAMLSGLTETELESHKCQRREKKNVDDCPFLWNRFNKIGYATLYAEEMDEIPIFHYKGRLGFVRKPTDYYYTPFMLAAERYTGHSGKIKWPRQGKLCVGGKFDSKALLDYIREWVKAMNNVPYFGFGFISTLTHNTIYNTSLADEPCLDFLRGLKEAGSLENTFLFFFSDHGFRFGDIRLSHLGMLEERLPMSFIIPPPWFLKEEPEAYNNLRINTNRLINNYDFYKTFLDVSIMNFRNVTLSNSLFEKRGQSLFFEVSENRTCNDIGIHEHWCSCDNNHEVSISDKYVKDSAAFVIDYLNENMKKFSRCATLSLKKVSLSSLNEFSCY